MAFHKLMYYFVLFLISTVCAMDFVKTENSSTLVPLNFLTFRYLMSQKTFDKSSNGSLNLEDFRDETSTSTIPINNDFSQGTTEYLRDDVKKPSQHMHRNSDSNNDSERKLPTESINPVKLTMRQALVMNQLLSVYALDNVKNELCKNHIKEFKKGLRAFQPWALKMFDSSSKLQSGILLGNLVDYGSYYQCLEIYQDTQYGAILGKHCVLKVVPSKGLIEKIVSFRNFTGKRFEKIFNMVEKAELGWSVCVPHTCPKDDILRHFNKTILDIGEGLYLKVHLDENYCNSDLNMPVMGTKQYIVLSVLTAFVILGLVAAIIDLQAKDKSQSSAFLEIFSAYRNIQKIFSPKTRKPEFDFLYGLKFISACFVVMGHRFVMYMYFPVINQLHELDWLPQYSSTTILGSTVTVDSFFLISGMLISIGFFEHVTKTNSFNLLIFYIHRYLRITLPISWVVLFYVSMVQFLSSGPFMYDVYMAHQKSCEDYWWSTLLHLQAYVNPGKLCIYPIWYISAEMSFYYFSPIILYPLWKYPKFGYVNLILIYIASLVLSFYLAWINAYDGRILPITNQLFDTKYFQKYYVTPHTRASPYLVGIGFGLLLFHAKDKTYKLNKWVNLMGWVSSTVVMILSVTGCHTFYVDTYEYNRLEASMYLAFSRSAWTFGLVWIMWICIQGQGGVLNEFLGAYIFKVFGRISYGIFLLHTIVQLYKTGSNKAPMTFSNFNVVNDALADLFLVFGVAFLFTIFLEMPVLQLEAKLMKVFVSRGEAKSNKVQPNQ